MAAAGAIDLRPVLKKLPAWVRCLLWGLAAVRLVLPIRFESAWSLVPSAETLSQNTVRYDAVPQLTSGITALNSAVNERLMEPYFRADAAVSVNPLHVWTEIAGFVWAAGCAALLLYALVRLVQTKRRVREAALLRGEYLALRHSRLAVYSGACFARGSICPRGWTARARGLCPRARAGTSRAARPLVEAAGLSAAGGLLVPAAVLVRLPVLLPGFGAGLRRAGRAGAGPRGAEGLFVRAALVRNGGTGGAGLSAGVRRGGCEGACETGAEL